MTNLILAVISIVLITVVSGISLYYGGSIWSTQTGKANTATLSSHTAQTEGAVTAYYAEQGEYPTSMADLVAKNYLKDVIPGEWTFEEDYVGVAVTEESECLALNKAHGIDTVPSCNDETYLGKIYCCSEDV